MPLIAFDHGPRDFQRLRDAALFQPVDEEPDVTGTAPHGVLRVIFYFEVFQVLAHQVFQRRLNGSRGFALLYAGHCATSSVWRGATITTDSVFVCSSKVIF